MRISTVAVLTATLCLGGAASGATTPPPAPDAVQAALAGMDAGPLKMVIDGSVKVVVRGKTSPLAFTLAEEFGAIEHIESPTRARWTMRAALNAGTAAATVYDGRAVMAGEDRKYDELRGDELATAKLMLEPASQRIRPTSLADLDNLTDLGPETVDGIATRHYTGTVQPAFIHRLFEGMVKDLDLSVSQRQVVLNALTADPSTVDMWIDESGKAWRQTVALRATLDIAVILNTVLKTGDAGLDLGTIAMEARLSFHPYEVGVPIAIPRPRAHPVASVIPNEAESQGIAAEFLLRTGARAMDNYAAVRGTYAGVTIRVLKRLEPGVTFKWNGAARSVRDEMRLTVPTARRFTLTTRTASGQTFKLVKTLDGPATTTCRKGKRACRTFF